MVFNSLAFAAFITIVFFAYWLLPHRYRWAVVLTANIYFYLNFDLSYFLILFLVTIISYFLAFRIKGNKILFVISIVLCLLPLLLCKYLNFSIDVLKGLGFIFSDKALSIIQPVGISFYTFEVISYLCDVYNRKIEAEKHLGYYACYVSFFGTISSGPIERAENFIQQLKQEKVFSYKRASYALKLFVWGLFKKIVIADNLAIYVNNIYDNLYEYKGFVLILIIFLYSIQIYCDFSGYSDMARGVAGLLGIDINMNFDSPYFSTTIREFWSRWHISLTSWFRDYIYIPLGGNRKGKLSKYINQIIVFFVSGLWHGANYTYIVWGLIHASLQILEGILKIKPEKEKNWKYYIRTLVLFAVVSLVWVFFRADTIADALYMFQNMFNGIGDTWNYLVTGIYSLDYEPVTVIIKIVIYLIPLFLFDMFNRETNVLERVSELKPAIKYMVYIVFVLMIMFLHNVGEVNFIYFKF